jgi:diguanylate cyclase (GGDEF)-like protein
MLLDTKSESDEGGYGDHLNASQLRDALENSQAQTHAAQEKMVTLTLINDCLCEELLEQESKLVDAQHLAYYDQLTGLPNRSLLQDRFQVAIANAIRYRRQLALLFLDLNDFKKINDQYGHAVGDKLLQRVGKRLSSSIRAIDTACRYGGDEFVLLLPDVDGLGGTTSVARKLGKTLSLPYHIEQKSHQLKVSIGIAVYPMDGDTFSALIRKADLAMYFVKANGVSEAVEVVAIDSGYGLPKKKGTPAFITRHPEQGRVHRFSPSR